MGQIGSGQRAAAGRDAKQVEAERRRHRFRRCFPNCGRVADVVRVLSRPGQSHHALDESEQCRDRSRSVGTTDGSTATGGSSPHRDPCRCSERRGRVCSNHSQDGVEVNTRLHLLLRPRSGDALTVSVERSAEVQQLKRGMGAEAAVLVFGTQLLADGTRWQDYEIGEGSVVELWPAPHEAPEFCEAGIIPARPRSVSVPRVPLSRLKERGPVEPCREPWSPVSESSCSSRTSAGLSASELEYA